MINADFLWSKCFRLHYHFVTTTYRPRSIGPKSYRHIFADKPKKKECAQKLCLAHSPYLRFRYYIDLCTKRTEKP